MNTTDKMSCEDLGSEYDAWLAAQEDLADDAAFTAYLDELDAEAVAAERLTPAAF